MKPETLKRIAEYIGYKATASCNCAKVCINPQKDKVFWKYVNYDPTTNPEQSMELLKALLDTGLHFGKCPITKAYYFENDHYLCSYEKQTAEQAILNAMASVVGVAEGNDNDTDLVKEKG